MFAKHDAELHHVVHRRGNQNDAIVDDACAFAWAQLLTHEYVALSQPRWRTLAWLTKTAVREAWRLHKIGSRAAPIEDHTIDVIIVGRGRGAQRGPDEIVAQHMRLDLVKQLPERPRRFLLRLAVGYSYHEIAEAENASYTTVNKQIARAKRLLRKLEATDAAGGE